MKRRSIFLLCLIGMLLLCSGCRGKRLVLDLSNMDSVEIVNSAGQRSNYNSKESNGSLEYIKKLISSPEFVEGKEEAGDYILLLTFTNSDTGAKQEVYIFSKNEIMYNKVHYVTETPMDISSIQSFCSS